MRTIITIIFCTIATLYANCQSLFEEGAVATYSYGSLYMDSGHLTSNSTDVSYHYEGDTIVNGKKFLRLIGEREDSMNGHRKFVGGYLRKDGDKVYRLSEIEGDHEDYILYDFGLKTGDVIDVPEWHTEYEMDTINGGSYEVGKYVEYRKIRCDNIEEIENSGRTYKKFWLTLLVPEINYEQVNWGFWIEDIGSTTFCGSPMHNISFGALNDWGGSINEVKYNDETIYVFDDEYDYFKNPSIVNIIKCTDSGDARKYKLNGMPFDENDRGIYIMGGKKYIKK